MEWIKVCKGLEHAPEVISLASQLDISRDEVLGKLFRFWSWADTHLTDGDAPSVTPAFVDELVSVTGFASALIDVGWLALSGTGLRVPNFDRHMGQSAKRRALTAERNAAYRRRKRDAPSVTPASLEKRREEKKESPPKPPKGGEYSESFKTFWKAYPRKVGKGKAFQRWKQHRPPLDAVLAALEWQSQTAQWQSEGGRFIPHPEGWLNQRRWEDEPMRGSVQCRNCSRKLTEPTSIEKGLCARCQQSDVAARG